MKTFAFLATLLASSAAFAQGGGPFFTNAPAGQSPTAISGSSFTANSDAVGFSDNAFASQVGAGTTQATATLITTRSTFVTGCAANAGLKLPAVNRYTTVVVVMRAGATCKIYPTPGTTVESVAGTDGAANAAATMTDATTYTFRFNGAKWFQ